MIKKIGVILAAGKGTRLKSKTVNKVVLDFAGKPMIQYAADFFRKTVDKTIVVIGAFEQSVRKALENYKVEYVRQKNQLGTGDALRAALPAIEKSAAELIFVGYGDHMMFLPENLVEKMQKIMLEDENTAVVLLTTVFPQPDKLAWGRIIRDEDNNIIEIIEQKDASPKQRKITELNAGFYCFSKRFLLQNINRIKKSPITGEYYINELIPLAIRSGKKIRSVELPFEKVGIGVNTPEELETSQNLFRSRSRKN